MTIFIGLVAAVIAILGIRAALRSPAPPPLPAKANQGQSNSPYDMIGCLILLILAAAICGFIWLVAPDRYAYAFYYHVDSDKVFVDKKPTNCDWSHAPLGDKDCHYKKVVMPQKDQSGNVTSIYVTWERIED